MTVSFTGINNLKTFRANKKGYGLFQGADGELKTGMLNLTGIKLKFTLTDDAAGQDMKELQKALKKTNRNYVYNTNEPDTVELCLKQTTSNDDVINITQSMILLNGQNLYITKREDLGLYTYLAKLTKKLRKLPNTTPQQQECTDLVNNAIHDNAVYYIDNIM